MNGTENIDVLIIGGGPIGLACGIACKKNGLSHRIIEKGTLVNSIYHYPVNMTFFFNFRSPGNWRSAFYFSWTQAHPF